MEGDQKAKKGTSEKRSAKKGSKGKVGGVHEADLTAAATGADLGKEGLAPETPLISRPKAARTIGATSADPKGGRKKGSAKGTAEPKGSTEPVTAGPVTVLSQAGDAAPKTSEEPSFEQIQLRAYFIAERRRQAGEVGDAAADWSQAIEELKSGIEAR